MAKVTAEQIVPASLAETWDLYFDPSRWPAWVDELHTVEELANGYPQMGGTVIWRSGPAGRGRVSETVLEHEPRRLHRIRYSDPSSEGEQVTSFAIEGEGTLVRLELSYSLLGAGPLSRITDLLFIRSQMRAMLARSLEGLSGEAAASTAAT
jgi:uncharacterized protein YndB with AHSA1/START domain